MKIKNTEDLDVGDIRGELLEKKPLPIGKKEFMAWSDRIIQGSLVNADPDSLRFSLAAMLMHLGPTDAFREDGYFILSLRKAAVNQTAYSIMEEMKEEQKKRQEQKQAEETAPNLKAVSDSGLLEDQKV